jgi:hypothetical protein
VLTGDEASALAELRDLVARVIAVDDFDAATLAAHNTPPAREPQAVEAEAARPDHPEHIAAE